MYIAILNFIAIFEFYTECIAQIHKYNENTLNE